MTVPVRFALALLFPLALLVTFYAVWISRPPVRDPIALEGILQATQQRLLSQQRLAQRRAENGFYAAGLDALAFSGAAPSSHPVLRASRAFRSHGRLSAGQPQRLSELMKTDPSGTATAIAEFESAWPAIRPILEEPHFSWPSEALRKGALASEPSLSVFRELGQGIFSYSEVLQMRGRAAEALDLELMTLHWGNKMARNPGLFSSLAGLSVARASLWRIVEILQEPGLSAEDCLRAAASLARYTAEHVPVSLVLKDELYMMKVALELVVHSHPGGPPSLEERLLLTMPGLLRREQRVLYNSYLDLIADSEVRPWRPPGRRLALVSDWQHFYRDEFGVLAPLMVPNHERTAAYDNIFLCEVEGARVLAELQAARLGGTDLRNVSRETFSVELPVAGASLAVTPERIQLRLPPTQYFQKLNAAFLPREDGVLYPFRYSP